MFDFWCLHLDTTPPDADGRGICTRCGATVTIRLTRQVFEDAVDAVYRNFGMFSHSKRCVRLDDGGFVCAEECIERRNGSAHA